MNYSQVHYGEFTPFICQRVDALQKTSRKGLEGFVGRAVDRKDGNRLV